MRGENADGFQSFAPGAAGQMSRTVLPAAASFFGVDGVNRPVFRSTPLVELMYAERLGREHFAVGAIDHVEIAVAVGPHQHLARLPAMCRSSRTISLMPS